jgi:hypothetical protein
MWGSAGGRDGVNASLKAISSFNALGVNKIHSIRREREREREREHVRDRGE